MRSQMIQNSEILFQKGIPEDHKLQPHVDEEADKFKDIVQANFTDAYFNNTIKSMMVIKILEGSSKHPL
jgi:Galactosyltransferase